MYYSLYRYDSTENWSSGFNENCILSTVKMNPLGGTQRNMIANDKDWDLYTYDGSGLTCRDYSPSQTSKKGNYKSLKYNQMYL